MKNYTPKSLLGVVGFLGLSLVLAGCSTDPAETLSLEDLIGRLQLKMQSTAGANGSAGFGIGEASNPKLTRPELSKINVPAPGTRQVFEWPEIVDLDIKPRISGENHVLKWPTVNWPAFDILSPEHRYFGHSGIIYYTNGRWHAISTEWLRVAREKQGVWYPYEEKFVMGHPKKGYPMGFFIAGPWRHQKNRKEYQRRSAIDWYSWPGLEPWDWLDGGDDNKGGEPKEPVITEIHVYILSFRTQLSGGTIVEFPVEVGDVELLGLREQTLNVVDSDVPTGTYEYVEFVLDPARSFLVVDNEEVPLGVPVTAVRVNGPFVVGPGGPTAVTLEFDPDKSLTKNADGSYTLNLVVVLDVNEQ